jgi:hypothetical protein
MLVYYKKIRSGKEARFNGLEAPGCGQSVVAPEPDAGEINRPEESGLHNKPRPALPLLIFRRLLDMVDDHDVGGRLRGVQLEPDLFLDGGVQSGRLIGTIGW